MNDSVITSRASLLALRCTPAATTPTTAAGRSPDDRHQRAADGNERLERAPPQILLRGVRGVERLADLRLQARLLVEADLEVREHGELRARLRIALDPPALVARERLAQVALPLGRVAGPQSVEEPLERRRLGRRVRRGLVEIARELEPDLLEHLQVPARDGVAGTLERVERRVQLGRQAPDPRLGWKRPRRSSRRHSVAIGCSSQRPCPSLRPSCSSRSSPRIVRPACREAQVAYVHQFAPSPLRAANAAARRE